MTVSAMRSVSLALLVLVGSSAAPVGLAVLKQPRVGSTWVKKELNQLPGVHLEFEPLTDGSHRCPSNFTNAVLGHLLREPLRCVNRKSRAKPCYWTKQQCSVDSLLALGGPANKSASEISGFLIHHVYVPSASWPFLMAAPAVRLVVLRRTNIIKRTVSNMLRVAEDGDDDAEDGGDNGSRPRALPAPPAAAAAASASASPPPPPRRERLDPSELARQARLSMLSLLRMPSGVDFFSEDHFLLLFEDLQTMRSRVLSALLRWLGKGHLAALLPPTGAHRRAPRAARTHTSLPPTPTNRARVLRAPALPPHTVVCMHAVLASCLLLRLPPPCGEPITRAHADGRPYPVPLHARSCAARPFAQSPSRTGQRRPSLSAPS